MNRREMLEGVIAGTAGVIGLGGTAAAAPSADAHLAKVAEGLRDLVRVQSAEGNWDYDPYMYGLANGLILALAMVEGGELKYLDAPAVWKRNNEPSGTPAGALERLSRALQADPDYANGWHANVACAAMDEGLDPAAANRAATRFMRAAFKVDTPVLTPHLVEE